MKHHHPPIRLSLRRRLFISAGLVLLVFLCATGLVLEQVYSLSLENFVREKLRMHTYVLLSVADNSHGKIQLPRRLSDQRLNTEGDSLIALVTDSQGNESWRSVSAVNRNFSLPAPRVGEWLFGRAQDSSGEYYYVSSFSTVWPDQQGKKTTFVFTVMEGINSYRQQSFDYRIAIALGLTMFGLIFLVVQAVILRWGLRPLQEVAADVVAMNKGELGSLEGRYPKELLPLTSNLNLLIDNERRQRERYRNRLADLSHSLKTPLSVLRGVELDTDDKGQAISRQDILDILKRQVQRMSDIVGYQLQRAVSGGQQTSFVAIPVYTAANHIVGALDKVYVDKAILTDIDIQPEVTFLGDENDLLEMLGNLLDNAYKHACHRVGISAHSKLTGSGATELVICVEDDGQGVPEAMRSAILERGARLDTAAEGQGIGLAVIVEITNSYGGTITIGESHLGGALFTLTILNN